MILVDLLHELVFRHSFGGVIYMPALVSESLDSISADIFKEEEFKTLVIHRVEDFWFANVHCRPGVPPTKSVVNGRG